MDTLKFEPDHLLIFVDDTGHEGLVGDQRYYGLGGAIFPALPYERLYKPAWREVRRIIKGSPDAPLHASEIGPNQPPEVFEALSDFFKLHFLRFAITTSAGTDALPAHMLPMHPVFELLKNYVNALSQLVDGYGPAALIVESSERADPLLIEHFGEFTLLRRGEPVEPDRYFLPKKANEPGLEIADFIVNAAGMQARFHLHGRKKLPLNFQSVFHRVPVALSRYQHVVLVEGRDGDETARGFELRSDPPSPEGSWEP